MFWPGSSSSSSASEDFSAISLRVAGMICMMPLAPTQLVASSCSPDSAMPCALNQRQSKPAPKNRFEYLRKW